MSKRIVICGGGFGGAYAAQALGPALRGTDARVLLINRTNYFTFYPLLFEAGSGTLEPRHAVVSIREFCGNRTTFRMGEVTGVDPAARQVSFRFPGRETIVRADYDQLVLALGSVSMKPPIPGLAEHAFHLKSLADAVALRDHAIELLELADTVDSAEERRALLHLVVVGGSYTGVELAGEFQAYLTAAARSYPGVDPAECRVTLLDIADRILPTLPESLADYARSQLERRGVRILLGETIREVSPEHVALRGGETLATHTVIWAAGIAPNPLLASLPFPTDERGYLRCDRELRVEGATDVWAIGDCAVNLDPQGQPYPATAQHAVRQAQQLARNLSRVLRGHSPLPCNIRGAGMLAALGDRRGVGLVMGLHISGFPAWWLWRTIYLMKMPGWTRRLRLALDWTIATLFPRDFVQLGVHRGRRPR